MCGRATLTTPDLETVAEMVEADFDPADAELYRPRFNIAPSDQHWVVRQEKKQRIIRPAVWGFTGKLKPLIINARAETVAEKFKAAFQNRRCIVPVDGFFEFTGTKKTRHPVWYHSHDKSLLLLAGLFEDRANGKTAFTILTTTPNKLVAPVHDRMPVIIPPEKMKEWLSAPSSYLLQPAPENVLLAMEVSSRANSVDHDGPECLSPWKEPEQSQMKLL